jgi:hypothetical protein
MAISNHERVNKAMDLLKAGLGPFAEREFTNAYQPVMRPGLTLSDEKKTAEGYTTHGSGVTEVERPWCLQPGSQPDPRAVFRHPFLLPPSW